ncbi:hypothetical protein GLOIN_2v1786600 [Rhizophagus irregularis DAOM 181602=DAOM 197198]|uniref:Uncharacterized protein n=1 Tax=Rhizophagus irregularis (strain DAOM 181602 / DAOM 197198 / MUCL 43194) TaxID=747089 RepID=A0A2P4P7W2_RHIID|nr:hypothetical protein GLOIN_2v1786600 [Rhizophagus irregularis DAOM 181602=DAOM 197198]POG61480.1 hypothetical protein GLOIN_2v1786600 [Rhizophagus irregularis DAOM 181602=DAOM 197198]CAG8751504.1 13074_t:CDS:2 [Rhizophagus irregularis]|eukprot:XP_025168346.1 hypothetical protein GLOIN_2v1786600 [Rhizophagus irregularis DAOM 181602=DAOM 197198]
MLKELDEALRKEVIRHYNALPESQRIDLRQTFIQQRELVNSSIIPSIMNNINNNVFPVTDEIIYNILSSLHRHRREEYLKKNLPLFEKKFQRKRKHQILDIMIAEWPNHKKKRERIIDPIILVKIKFQRLYRYQQPEQPKQPDPNNELVDNGLSILSRIYNEEEVEKEEKEVGEVMLTSSDN